jgi:hypothetical protein
VSLQPAYEGRRRLGTPSGPSETAPQLVWDAAAELSWLAGQDLSVSAAYLDQTLFGPAMSSSLSRSVTVGVQKRWLR